MYNVYKFIYYKKVLFILEKIKQNVQYSMKYISRNTFPEFYCFDDILGMLGIFPPHPRRQCEIKPFRGKQIWEKKMFLNDLL